MIREFRIQESEFRIKDRLLEAYLASIPDSEF